jgi:diguanylate cyclase (GGDEF)-like protein
MRAPYRIVLSERGPNPKRPMQVGAPRVQPLAHDGWTRTVELPGSTDARDDICRLVLVEDNESDALLVNAWLDDVAEARVEVVRVDRAAAGRDYLLEHGADCVLLDLTLPDASGLDAVRTLRAVSHEIPIVVLSGVDDHQLALEALQEGAQDYLLKHAVTGDLLWRSLRFAIERKRNQLLVERQALIDPLTGLANRTLFRDRLAHALAGIGRTHGRVGVLFLDVDRFKLVNDALGHEAGDELLIGIAERIGKAVRVTDSVARVGGDEFLVLASDLGGVGEAVELAERLADSIRPSFQVRGSELHVTASIGIALTSDATVSAVDLVRDADVAMYRAKERGRARVELFDPRMHQDVEARLEREIDLHRALDENRFVVQYQPIIDLTTGHAIGAEALVRCLDRAGVLLGPAEFIGLAEDSGVIVPMGDLVMREACRVASTWRRANAADQWVSVNLSPRQLGDPSLSARIANSLDASALDPKHLWVEITEHAIFGDERAAAGALAGLKDLGVRVALDDFGTGYSSLSHLKRFPIDAVKVDQTFVAGLGSDPFDVPIVRAMVGLADDLGVSIIAEGVETEQQADQLRALGCSHAQGFFFGRPSDADAVAPMMRRG